MKKKVGDILVTSVMTKLGLMVMAMCLIRWFGGSILATLIPVLITAVLIPFDMVCIWILSN